MLYSDIKDNVFDQGVKTLLTSLLLYRDHKIPKRDISVSNKQVFDKNVREHGIPFNSDTLDITNVIPIISKFLSYSYPVIIRELAVDLFKNLHRRFTCRNLTIREPYEVIHL